MVSTELYCDAVVNVVNESIAYGMIFDSYQRGHRMATGSRNRLERHDDQKIEWLAILESRINAPVLSKQNLLTDWDEPLPDWSSIMRLDVSFGFSLHAWRKKRPQTDR